MTDLKTTFAGLSLRNPIIISSSGLTNSVGKNKKLAEDGAGAIVLKMPHSYHCQHQLLH